MVSQGWKRKTTTRQTRINTGFFGVVVIIPYGESGSVRHDAEKIQKEYYEIDCKLQEVEPQYSALSLLRGNKFDCVLSFNYTNTYEELYGDETTQYCYIHGKAQADVGKTNMILGIDDTLSSGDESKNFAFVKFKKYYQRVFNKTGSEYRDWIALISDSEIGHRDNEIFIVGHSLGATDHDVLREFFNLGKVARINVMYFDECSKINAIERTIEIIGKEALIDRVHGLGANIRFIDQYEEQDGVFIKRAKKRTAYTA
jgi:hypothetical protein